ncbi:WGR domain-containing protein [Aureivirga marina]|uniref:WGR domain-containing protein n=1 Tax=Aureivirga marina TaxID=1182451 RepID=UPI0018CB434F|nr:WGR domain-containing protein [Aureivirga marina]
MQKTYLELSQDSGSAHKFYEVIVDGVELKIRYGRIGTDGTNSSKSFATEDAAQKEATKKINAKKRKGYEEAVMGVRKKRSITRRATTSRASTAKSSPVLWKFKSGSSAFGIYVDDNYCWVGNQEGRVFKLTHEGEVVNQYQLPDGVKCIIGDEDWIYVGCDDGNVYDLTGKLPRLAYEINEDVDIYWLDINNGLLAVSDAKGNVTCINYEDEEQWSQKSQGSSGWMVRLDEVGRVFHGHSTGVTCYYGFDGNKVWEQSTNGTVLFGWYMNNMALAGTGSGKLELFNNAGEKQMTMNADSTIYSCASSQNNEYFFAGDSNSSIYCFDKDGSRLWKLATTCSSALSMQYFNEKLYIVTSSGELTCIDASEEAINLAKEGTVPTVKDIKAPQKIDVIATDILETVDESREGVKLKCQKVGSKLRVRVISSGYNYEWNVQFPKNLRIENAEFMVDDIKEVAAGGFYRVVGDIYKLN